MIIDDIFRQNGYKMVNCTGETCSRIYLKGNRVSKQLWPPWKLCHFHYLCKYLSLNPHPPKKIFVQALACSFHNFYVLMDISKHNKIEIILFIKHICITHMQGRLQPRVPDFQGPLKCIESTSMELTRPVLDWFQDSSKTGSGINFFPTFFCRLFGACFLASSFWVHSTKEALF